VRGVPSLDPFGKECPTMNETTTLDLHLDEEERALVLALLEQAFGDTRVEAHRTHTPSYRADVLRNEEILRRLIAKFRPSGT
jgi:hypothetical protein